MPDSNVESCPFCQVNPRSVTLVGKYASVVREPYPISVGHVLIVPHRHVGSFFDLTVPEVTDIVTLLFQTRVAIDTKHHPQGYTIGIDSGQAAGQSVPHVCIQLVPRYSSEPAPKGVRNVIPEKYVHEGYKRIMQEVSSEVKIVRQAGPRKEGHPLGSRRLPMAGPPHQLPQHMAKPNGLQRPAPPNLPK